MENTCRKEKCPEWELHGDHCANFIENWWTPKEPNSAPILILDCAKVRTIFLLQDILIRLEGFQQAQEQQRNVNMDLINTMTEAITVIQENPNASLNIALTSGKANQVGRLQAGNNQ